MPTLQYCSTRLDRNAALRQDRSWLNAQLASDSGLVTTLWSQQHLVRTVGNDLQPAYLAISEAALILANAAEVIYLGHDKDQPVFAADLGELSEQRLTEILQHAAPECEMADLRSIGSLLEPKDGSILAYARSLTYWHQQNGFCSRCGHTTHSRRGGHMRYCHHCTRENFPRIDPAVIMLVEQKNPTDGIARCLLGRHEKLPRQMYSTLAGFLDPGESLEQAVIREVYEEAGLRVIDPIYMGSQPWPFPSSMMLGFRARTNDREIVVAVDELEDARWFSRQEVRKFGNHGDPDCQISLPRSDSIARLLIDTWLDEES